MRTTTAPETEAESEGDAGTGADGDFVTTSFEACASFAPATDGSPVCDACGWLLGEHDHALADVRALPRAVRVQARPRRLAS